MDKQLPKKNPVRTRTTAAFKLKDRNKPFIVVDLMQQFGFIPERIVVEKVQGKHNTMVLRGILTEEEIKKEDVIIKKLEEVKKEPKQTGKGLL